jgi:hypothetical protein
MKFNLVLPKVKVRQPISPVTLNMLITDASVLLLLLISFFKIIS